MLGITKYLKSLIMHIEKSDVLEDLRVSEKELQTIVLPAVSEAANFFASDKFTSPENIAIDNRIRGVMKFGAAGRPTTFLSEFAFRLTKLEHNAGVLIRLIDREIGRDVITDGIPSKRVVLMRIAEKFTYISRATLDLLNLVYLNEALANGANAENLSMSPAEMVKAKSGIDNVARLLEAYGIDAHKFEHDLDSTPDIVLTRADDGGLEGTFADSDIDPLTPAVLVGFTGNPIYHLGMAYAEWQVDRYKANQEKKKILELRLLHLSLVRQQKGTNPALEREIQYNQQRLAKLDRKLAQVQEELDLTN